MEFYYMACAGISTAAVVVGAVHLVRTLDEVRLTAEQARRTAAAVENLARHLDENVEAVGGITRKVVDVVDGVRSGWVQAFKVGLGLLTAFRERRGDAEPDSSESAPRS